MGKLIQGGKLHSLTTRLTAAIIGAGLLLCLTSGQAQISSDTPPLPLDLPLASADVATNNGTFWTAQNPDSAPLPFNPFPDLPVYELGNGTLLLDDRTVDYPALAQQRLAQRALLRATAQSLGMSTMEGIPGFDEGEGGGDFTSDFQSMVFNDSDLFLKIMGVTNTVASMWIHPPATVTNGVYDLYYTTNLTTLVPGLNYTNWQWLLRTDAGQTNLTVPNATDEVGFYRLGPPNDLAATSSMGTNFWLAFCNLPDGFNNKLSLYISSPAGATGTVSVTSPIVVTPGGFDTNFLNLIVTQLAITNTLVDGSHVASNDFVAIGSSGYYGAQVPVTNGTHKVTSSQPVGVQVYGWGYEDAYGYFGGIVK